MLVSLWCTCEKAESYASSHLINWINNIVYIQEYTKVPFGKLKHQNDKPMDNEVHRNIQTKNQNLLETWYY